MFRKNSGIEKFQAKEGGASRFCRKCFYLTGPKKFRQGTILCFRKFLIWKKILWIRGGVSRFSVEVFVSLYRNNSLENTLVFQKNSFNENFHAWEGGGGGGGFITIFSRKFYVSLCRKTSYRNPLVFH